MLARFISKFMPVRAGRGFAENMLIITAAAVAVGASLYAAPGLRGWLGAGLALLMLAIAVVDQRQFRIPNTLVAAATVLGLLHAAVVEPLAPVHASLAAALRGCGLGLLFLALRAGYERWRGREGMGLGD